MPNFPNKYFPPKANNVPPNHAQGVREKLLAHRGDYDEFDIHVMSCILANALAERSYHPITEALALTRNQLEDIITGIFPGSYQIDELVEEGATAGEDAVSEAELRELLISYLSNESPIEEWIASVFARRCQVGDHMWRSIGLYSRDELTQAMLRYFRPLAQKNIQNLRWKRFIYKQMRIDNQQSLEKYPYCDNCNRYMVVEDEQGNLSRYPYCAHCPDLAECSSTEEY